MRRVTRGRGWTEARSDCRSHIKGGPTTINHFTREKSRETRKVPLLFTTWTSHVLSHETSHSTLNMDGPNLRDEAVRDRIRLAEEFLDRGE